MVPEWQQAYMDYDFLKTLLKEIITFKRRTNNAPSHGGAKTGGGLNRKLTLYRAFSGLVSTPRHKRSNSTHDVEEGIQLTGSTKSGPILVNTTASHGYETTFLMAAEEGGEYELVFFRRLDDEFNKVEKFYKKKVEEVLKEAAMLNKQMDALIAFRVKVENPDGWRWEERTVEMTRLASDIATSAAALSASTPAGAKSMKVRSQEHMEAIQEGGSSRAGLMEDDEEDEEEQNETSVCLRRLFEEKNPEQGYNGLKYFLTIVAVCLRTAYSIQKGQVAWRVLAAVFSFIAAIFCTYWDFVHDWGLLNRTSKNRWLRDKLLVPQKKVYFIAMVLNVLLRFAWIQTVLDFNFSFMHRQTMVAIVASLEIIRRGIWNFFRLENEHLNNVGKYRAFKSVPLPFNYDEDDDKDN
ncbi:unnamed protein product [Arabidopsis thaliana]|uniref:(thale cress) hypothetical protein n=1 Tax=Arabidopsis thaliana TaxID=3702 RepID=A0A7G2DQL3_ARATH|nr:unnamed protein product [Arabidopsis thaliana]